MGGQVYAQKVKKIGMEAYIGKVIPRYAFFSVIFCFVFNSLIYTGTQIIMKDAKHYDLSTPFDYSVPFIPGWVLVYVICFGFWAANYIIITREGNEDWFKFATGDYLSRVVCMVFLYCCQQLIPGQKLQGMELWKILCVLFILQTLQPTFSHQYTVL